MKRFFRTRALGILAMILSAAPYIGFATDISYPDITAQSASRQFQVTARSPDKSFVYECRDLTNGTILWSRRQSMSLPKRVGRKTVVTPEESSPFAISVSDSGWTILLKGEDEVTAVAPTGEDRWIRHLFKDVFSRDDNRHVQVSSAGRRWTGLAHWYFVEEGEHRRFAIRPWWGRRLVLDLATGESVPATGGLAKLCEEREAEFAREWLRRAQTMEDVEDQFRPIVTAAHLAGTLRLHETVADLRRLESFEILGAFWSGSSDGKGVEGRLDLAHWRPYSLRRTAQLSLRRLGERPSAFPATQFEIHSKADGVPMTYEPPPLKGDREAGVEAIQAHMTPEDVAAQVGLPDFNDGGTWYYEIDGANAYTLRIDWKVARVENTQRITPPLWTTDRWDRGLTGF